MWKVKSKLTGKAVAIWALESN